MVYFWAKAKSNTFHVKLLWLGFGQLLKNLDYFLIQHLVTLPIHQSKKRVKTFLGLRSLFGF